MGFRGEMHNGVHPRKKSFKGGSMTNIAFHKTMAWRFQNPGQIIQVPRVRQLIQCRYLIKRMFFHPISNKMRPDKTSPAGHNHFHGLLSSVVPRWIELFFINDRFLFTKVHVGF